MYRLCYNHWVNYKILWLGGNWMISRTCSLKSRVHCGWSSRKLNRQFNSITKHKEYLLTITGKFEFICNWRSSETSPANSRRWSWRRVETRNFQDITTPNAFKLTPHLDYELLFIGSFNILSQSREQWINGERNLGGLLSTQENDIFSLKI